MDLMVIKMKLAFLELIWFKYRLLEFWSSSSSLKKYSIFIITSGGLAVACNFLKASIFKCNKEDDDASLENDVQCERREKGKISAQQVFVNVKSSSSSLRVNILIAIEMTVLVIKGQSSPQMSRLS